MAAPIEPVDAKALAAAYKDFMAAHPSVSVDLPTCEGRREGETFSGRKLPAVGPAERAVACLLLIGGTWLEYRQLPEGRDQALYDRTFEVVTTAYNYAASTLDAQGRRFVDANLPDLESAPDKPSPSPDATTLKSLAGLAKQPIKSMKAAAVHRAWQDAVDATVPAFAFTSPYDRALMALRDPFAACEVALFGTSDAYESCGQAGFEGWRLYLTTGDPAFYDYAAAVQSFYVPRQQAGAKKMGGTQSVGTARKLYLDVVDCWVRMQILGTTNQC